MAAFISGMIVVSLWRMVCMSPTPCAFQVRELATRVKALKKVGEKNPFVAVELKKYACCGVLSVFLMWPVS